MRTNKKLLQILLDNIEEIFSDTSNICNGLCILTSYLCEKKIISRDEKGKIKIYLSDCLPKRIGGCNYNSLYCWKPGELEPRVKWLEEQINICYK